MAMPNEEKITTLITDLLNRPDFIERGIRLHSIKMAKGKHSLLRVYIEKEDGVSIDDCTYTHRELSVLLDIEDIIDSSYVLEISSPGIGNKR